MRQHHRAVGAERGHHRAHILDVAVALHGLEALKVRVAHHVGEVLEHRAAGADRRVIPARLPAAPAQRDACVRRVLVEHRQRLPIAILQRPVVGVGLRIGVPGIVGAGVGLELREQRETYRWLRGCTRTSTSSSRSRK